MAALPHPDPEDLVIRREESGAFSIGVNSGTPQIVSRTFEEALQFAAALASSKHARVWWTADGVRCAPFADLGLVRKIWNEYVEMPGLRLTRAQAQRLWTIDAETCDSLLQSLVEWKFLVRGTDGKYGRQLVGTEPLTRLRMARTEVDARRAAGKLQRAG
jgi:hypothetical protein